MHQKNALWLILRHTTLSTNNLSTNPKASVVQLLGHGPNLLNVHEGHYVAEQNMRRLGPWPNRLISPKFRNKSTTVTISIQFK